MSAMIRNVKRSEKKIPACRWISSPSAVAKIHDPSAVKTVATNAPKSRIEMICLVRTY